MDLFLRVVGLSTRRGVCHDVLCGRDRVKSGRIGSLMSLENLALLWLAAG